MPSAARLTEPDSGLGLTTAQVGIAAAIYVAGACTRRPVLRLAHRPVRPQEAVHPDPRPLPRWRPSLTAFSFTPLVFFLFRFFTGAGIGGEYAAINSAIDELIPARRRGRVDLVINGSYWLGTAFGAVLTRLPAEHGDLPGRYRLAHRVRPRRRAGARHPARPPQRAGVAALDVHPRPRRGGRDARRHDRARHRGGDRREAGGRAEDKGITIHQRRSIRLRRDRPHRVHAVPEARRARACRCSSARRSSTTPSSSPTALVLTKLLRVPDDVAPWALVPRRGRQLPRPAAARPPVRHGRAQAHDHAVVRRLGGVLLVGTAMLFDAGVLDAFWLIGAAGWSSFFFASAGASARLPDGQRDLPDGDPRDGDRVLLRDRHRDRRHHRADPVRPADRERQPRGRDRLLHRRRPHDRRRLVELFLGVEAEGKSLEDIAQAAHRRGRRRRDADGRRRGRVEKDPAQSEEDDDARSERRIRERIEQRQTRDRTGYAATGPARATGRAPRPSARPRRRWRRRWTSRSSRSCAPCRSTGRPSGMSWPSRSGRATGGRARSTPHSGCGPGRAGAAHRHATATGRSITRDHASR